MRSTTDRIQLLRAYGLNDYQARAYLALLEYPSLIAGTLAKICKVPRNRLYEVLDELQEIGLVEILLEDPRRYRARPLSGYLDRRMRGLQEQIQEITERMPYLDAAFQPSPAHEGEGLEVGEFRIVSGRRAVAREIDQLVEGMKSSLVAMSTPGSFERLLRHVAMFSEHIEALSAEAPFRTELLVPARVAERGGTEELPPPIRDAIQWTRDEPQTLSVIVDERTMLVVHPLPDDEKPRNGKDVAIFTTNSGFIRDQLLFLQSLPRVREDREASVPRG